MATTDAPSAPSRLRRLALLCSRTAFLPTGRNQQQLRAVRQECTSGGRRARRGVVNSRHVPRLNRWRRNSKGATSAPSRSCGSRATALSRRVWLLERVVRRQVCGERLEDLGRDARPRYRVRAVRVVDHDRDLLRRLVGGDPLVAVEDRVLEDPSVAADDDPEPVADLGGAPARPFDRSARPAGSPTTSRAACRCRPP